MTSAFTNKSLLKIEVQGQALNDSESIQREEEDYRDKSISSGAWRRSFREQLRSQSPNVEVESIPKFIRPSSSNLPLFYKIFSLLIIPREQPRHTNRTLTSVSFFLRKIFNISLSRSSKVFLAVLFGFSLGATVAFSLRNIFILNVLKEFGLLCILFFFIFFTIRLYFYLTSLVSLLSSLDSSDTHKSINVLDVPEGPTLSFEEQNYLKFEELLQDEVWFNENQGRYVLIVNGELQKVFDIEVDAIECLRQNAYYSGSEVLLDRVEHCDILNEPTSVMLMDYSDTI